MNKAKKYVKENVHSCVTDLIYRNKELLARLRGFKDHEPLEFHCVSNKMYDDLVALKQPVIKQNGFNIWGCCLYCIQPIEEDKVISDIIAN